MDIVIVREPITRVELKKIAEKRFGDLVKAAVDIKHEIMVVGGEMHIDEQNALIQEIGSKNQDVWGVNIRPEEIGDKFIQFDSMINLKPNYGNRSRDIDNPDIKRRVIEVVNKLIK